MASRVNKKLVVLLVVGIVVICAGGIGLYSFVLNRGPEENVRAGDKAMAEGDFAQARRLYGRAVNKDPNNVEWLNKWRDAIVAWEPDTETAYVNEFTSAWIPLMKALANAQPNNVDAADNYLDLLYQMAQSNHFQPSEVSNIDRETSSLLAMMSAANPTDLSRDRLRRYRALARVELVRRGKAVTREDRENAAEDLLAVLDQDPEDGAASIGLSLLEQAQARESLSSTRWDEYETHMQKAQKYLVDHLRNDPDDPAVIESLFALKIDRAVEKARRGKVGAAAQNASQEAIRSFKDQFDDLINDLSSSSEPLETWLIDRTYQVELLVDPESKGSRTLALLEQALSDSPDDAQALYYFGNILKQRKSWDRASEIFNKIVALKQLPVGLAGMNQLDYQKQALRNLAEIALSKRESLDQDDEAGRAATLAKAREYRDQYAQRVSENDLGLQFLDALISKASGDLRAALSQLQRFNRELASPASQLGQRGLWEEGQIASQLGEFGRAREAFKKMADTNKNSPSALVALASTERALQNNQVALDLFQEASRLLPGNAYVAEQIRQLQVELGLATSDDPVEQALADARLAMAGTADQPGRPADAIAILKDAIANIGYDPKLSRELATLYLYSKDLESARDVVARAAAANPEDSMLEQLKEALKQDNMLDANVAMIESSTLSETQKAVNLYRLYRDAGEEEKAQESLARAVKASPDNAAVIEMNFIDAISRGEVDKARSIFEDANKRGVIGDSALLYRARLEAVEGKTQEAIDTLTQAIELGSNQAAVYRLLGTQLRIAGLNQRALDAFETAYKIKPDDIDNATALIQMLWTMGDRDKALSIARESERFGRGNTGFMNLWLQMEAEAGGEEGLARAITVRKQLYKIKPEDRTNRVQLAQLYMDLAGNKSLAIPDQTRAEHWKEAKRLIDELKGEQHDLTSVTLEARWLADQGRVPQEDGTTIDGIEAARGVFIEYILSLGDDVTVEPYIEMARFMSARGRYGVAESALKGAREYQSEKMEVEKVLGSLYMQSKAYAAAADSFAKVIEAGQDDEGHNYRIRLIEMLLKTGEYEKAKAELDKLPESMSDNLTVLLQRAEAAQNLGNDTEAAGLFDRAVARYPQNPLPYTRRAEFRLRDPAMIQDVLADLGQALSLNPNDIQTLRLRASVYGQQDRYDEMLADLRAALRADPSQTNLLVSVMLEYLMKGDDGRAMDAVEETLRRRPRDLMLIAQAAKTFEDRQYWKRAAELFKRGWEMSGDYSFGLAYINSLIEQDPPKIRDAELVMRAIKKQTGKAEEDWQVDFADAAIKYKKSKVEASDSERNSAEALLIDVFKSIEDSPNELAKFRGNLSGLYKDEDARRIAFLRKLTDGLPEDSVGQMWAKFFLAIALSEDEASQQEAEEILESMESLGESSSFARYAYRQHGGMYYANKEFDKAIEIWTRGLDIFPGDWEMSNNAAFTLATEVQEPEKALPFALSAVQAAPQQAEAYDSLARVYIGSGEFEKAAEALSSARRYSRSKRSDVSIMVTQADLDIERGKIATARRSLERLRLSISLIPDLRGEFESDIDALLRKIDSLGG